MRGTRNQRIKVVADTTVNAKNLTLVDTSSVTWTVALDAATEAAEISATASGGGGGGSSDHATLSHLTWSSSAHTGTASRIAGFDGAGAAAYYQIGVDIQAYDADLTALGGLGNGLPYRSAGTWAAYSLGTGLQVSGGSIQVDTSVIATQAWVSAGYQPLDAGLTSLTAADATAGLPYVSAANTWATATYASMLSVVGGAWKVVGLRESGGTDLSIGTIGTGVLLGRGPTASVGGVSVTSPLALSGGALSVGDASTGAKGIVQLAGDIAGSATSVTVTQARGLRESSGPTTLSMGAVSDGDGLARVGTEIVGVNIGQVSSLNAAAKLWFQIRMDGTAAAGVGTAVLVGQVTGTITYRTASSVIWPDVGLAGNSAGGYATVRTNNLICRPDQNARHSFAILCSSGTANLRVWATISGGTAGSDTPANATMGLVYNPNVSANWQVVCYSGAGSVYYADTGKAYVANERVEISFLATSTGCTGKIRTAGGTWTAEQTVTSGVPASSTALYHLMSTSRITGGTTAAATVYFVGSSAEASYV